MNKPLRILFFIQGEGRGHLSQAIAMKEILTSQGHQVVGAIYGRKNNRAVPEYLEKHFSNSINYIDSPYLLRDKNNRKTLMFLSFLVNIAKSFYYLGQLKKIHSEIKKNKPQLIFNFHEMMCGFYLIFYKSNIPVISVARQYFYYHHRFHFPSISVFSIISLLLVNYFSTFRSVKRLGLNFTQLDNLKAQRLAVFPPLIREEIKKINYNPENQILVYLLNSGYQADVIRFHQENPDIRIVCFWERESVEKDKNLSFIQITEERFSHELSKSMAVISNAGFDLIAECSYLGIPVIMILVEQNPEQFINAVESVKTGAVIAGSSFNSNNLNDFIKNYKANLTFKKWADSCPELIEIEIQKLIDKNLIR